MVNQIFFSSLFFLPYILKKKIIYEYCHINNNYYKLYKRPKKKNLVMKTLYSEIFLSYIDSILAVISILSLSSIKDNYFIFIINNDICIIIWIIISKQFIRQTKKLFHSKIFLCIVVIFFNSVIKGYVFTEVNISLLFYYFF